MNLLKIFVFVFGTLNLNIVSAISPALPPTINASACLSFAPGNKIELTPDSEKTLVEIYKYLQTWPATSLDLILDYDRASLESTTSQVRVDTLDAVGNKNTDEHTPISIANKRRQFLMHSLIEQEKLSKHPTLWSKMSTHYSELSRAPGCDAYLQVLYYRIQPNQLDICGKNFDFSCHVLCNSDGCKSINKQKHR